MASVEVIASVSEQKMVIVRDGAWVKKYRVSTSRFGLGDSFGSYKTPVGRLRVCEKLGDGLPTGAVIKHRQATGEILEANAPGRDPIVSRILWLEGLESQNEHARARSIYIHGTPEEARIGRPVSWGCIRMRSEDIVELYDMVPIGTVVTIFDEDLPRLPKWKPEPPPTILAKNAAPVPHPQKVESAPQRLALPQRFTEIPLPVAELLRSHDARPIPADPGAAAALRGSILFAGLSQTPKRTGKTGTPRETPSDDQFERAFAFGFTPFVLTATLPSGTEFSLTGTLATSRLRVVDLRRLIVEPESTSASLLDAPEGSYRLAWLTRDVELRLIRTLLVSPSGTPASF